MTRITMIVDNVATVEVNGVEIKVTAEEWREGGAVPAFRDIEIRRIAELKHTLATKNGDAWRARLEVNDLDL